MPDKDCAILLNYLEQKQADKTADLVLRNIAFETLFKWWDVLIPTP